LDKFNKNETSVEHIHSAVSPTVKTILKKK